MKVADSLLVLFGGAGLATKGLVESGCAKRVVSVEMDSTKSMLSEMLNPTVEHIVADVRDLDREWINSFPMCWSSPPCQERSSARTQGDASGLFADDLLDWCLSLPHEFLWVENVRVQGSDNAWGTAYNAAQFEEMPRQNRPRVIGGRYLLPVTYRPYSTDYAGICNTITASEWKGCASDRRRASRWYGRRLSLRECAYHQGLEIPDALLRSWFHTPSLINPETGRRYTDTQWRNNLYQAIGNGVPVYFSRAFGEAYSKPTGVFHWLETQDAVRELEVGNG